MLGSVDKFQHCKRLIGMEHYYTDEMDYTGVGLDRFYFIKIKDSQRIWHFALLWNVRSINDYFAEDNMQLVYH